jgi:methyltransferase (TIGR00027 family)
VADIITWVRKTMPSDNPEKESLASTACWVAAVRAHEHEQEDRLFDDPWAALLAGPAGQAWIDRMALLHTRLGRMSRISRISMHWGKPGKEWGHPTLRLETSVPEHFANTLTHDKEASTEIGLVIRTKFFDDFLLHTTREHEIRQIVFLAAGMDTRAFRLAWPPHTRLFELDQPELLAQKEQILASAGASPTCRYRTLGIDLVEEHWPDALLRASFDPRQATVWLIEGLLPYLSESAIPHLLNLVTALSASGSYLGLTAINRAMLTSSAMRFWLQFMEQAGTPWLSAMDEPEAFLAKRGWIATAVQPGEKSAHFGRWSYPVTPRSVPNIPRTWFVTAKRP